MAVTKTSKVFGIDDLKIFPITEDSSSTYTVGTSIDIPGAKSLSINFEIDEKELTGDEDVLDIHTKIKKLTYSIDYAKLDLDLLSSITGGKVVDNTTDQTFSLQDGDIPGYFQLQAKINDVDPGDIHIILPKCKISAIPISGNEDDYASYSISGSAIKTTKEFTRGETSKGLKMDIKFNETAAELSAMVS